MPPIPLTNNKISLFLSNFKSSIIAPNNSFVISSDCKNGPQEFLQNGKAGMLFESNKNNALFDALTNHISQKPNLKAQKILAKKNCLKYSLFRHHKIIKNILLD